MWKIGFNLSKIYSFVFQPMLMPFYSVMLLLLYTNFFSLYPGQTFRFLLPILIFSFIIPSVFILALAKMRYIHNVLMEKRSDRTLPYIIFIVSNISLTFFFYQAHVPFWFLGLVVAPIFVSLAGLVINAFWKISVHMLAIGGLIGGVLSVCFNVKASCPIALFSILFLIAGLLGVSRLYLKASSPSQIYVGFLIGLAIAYGSVYSGLILMFYFFR